MNTGADLRQPVLSVENLGVHYGALVALEGVSWSVNSGEILGIIGPNGAGKSTCYDAVSALVKRSGRVLLRGVDITATPPYDLSRLGMKRAFQQNAFFNELTVLENMVAALGGTPNIAESVLRPIRSARRTEALRVEAAAVLKRFNIRPEVFELHPSEISYGMQRMLSIALAYGGGAVVLMLDEPAAGLGGEDMATLIKLLENLRDEGLALVVIEHHMDLMMAVADKICVLNLGRLLAFGTAAEIRSNPQVLTAYLGTNP